MGVPGFFAWLLRKYDSKNIISKLDKNIKYDILYLDANCLFHPQCFIVLDEQSDKKITKVKLELLMIKKIIEYIDYLVTLVNPTLLYVGVDGVAPMAKVSQQRQRRFKSVIESDLRNKIKDKYDIKYNNNWSNTCITPGSVFMEKLHVALEKHFKKYTIPVTYSSYHECGEGEHKILQDIKVNNYTNIVIYGLDADLIFLALASRQNIYLLREETHINNTDKQDFVIIDIKVLRVIINSIFTTNTTVDYCDDFVIICYLLGNDFLPHLPSIDIKTGGLELLIKCYLITQDKLNSRLVVDNKINMTFLKFFIKKISDFEDNYFTKILPRYNRPKQPKPSNSYENALYNFDNLIGLEVTDPVKYNEQGYKDRYYKHYFNTNSNSSLTNQLCNEYIKGIFWTFEYYFNKCVCWSWQYMDNHAPFMSDIALFLNRCPNTTNFLKNINSKPSITPITQLLIVLPPDKNIQKLLPKEYRNLELLKKYFPAEVTLDYFGKDQFWKVIANVPIVDVSDILHVIKDIKLKPSDLKRDIVHALV